MRLSDDDESDFSTSHWGVPAFVRYLLVLLFNFGQSEAMAMGRDEL